MAYFRQAVQQQLMLALNSVKGRPSTGPSGLHRIESSIASKVPHAIVTGTSRHPCNALLTALRYRYDSAAELQDKVFGLLGLMCPGFRESFGAPDYKMSPKEVFIHFAITWIRHTSSLPVLYMAGKCYSNTDLPSWVPD